MAASMSRTGTNSVAHANHHRLSKKTKFNYSSVPSSSTFFSTSDSRVSFASPAKLCSISLRSSARNLACSCSLHSLKVKAKEELVESKDSSRSIAASVSASRTFLNARTEEELLSGIRKEAEVGSLPSYLAMVMEELYQTYKNAVFQSGDPRAKENILSNMSVILDRVYLDIMDPFVFQPYHKAVRKPFDYYKFGQNYIRPLVDFRNSYVGNISIFYDMEEKLKQGHNIILMSNHQTEADPAIIALLLETAVPYIAENLTYVAGDRVITDPLCKPFSMGRNLICVYSKKHMYDHPELVEMKRKANTRSLKEMAMLLRHGYSVGSLTDYRSPTARASDTLRGGSQIFWIAPSGGRDRPDPLTGEWVPAPFDVSSVDNMRRLAEHAGRPGHVYPLAILCHNVMPPPPQVEKEIGERRVISFSGAGLSVTPEISFSETTAACKNYEEAKEAYSQTLYNSVTEQYNVLKSAIHGQQGFEASIPNISLFQPWI